MGRWLGTRRFLQLVCARVEATQMVAYPLAATTQKNQEGTVMTFENVAAQEFSTVIDLHTVHDDYMAGRIPAHEISGDATTLYEK